MQQLLQRGLQMLAPAHREILVLREVEGMEYDAIAEVLGCERGTVKSRLARAREQLRLKLIEIGGADYER
jgi:RNA polymerase sigma-70 factor (ECF subfamily)